MNPELLSGLNEHLTLEFRASHEYLAMSIWLAENDLPGFAAWMRKQSGDELLHAQKVIDHLVERDQKVKLPAIPEPLAEWPSAQAIVEQVYRSEQAVTHSINNLYSIAEKAKDRPATVLLQWFVNEQVEEESMARAVVGRLKLAGSTGIGLLMIDQELAAGKVPGMMTMMAPTSASAGN
jgi:ferritin